MSRPMILIGAGGHGRVLLDTLVHQGNKILGITSANPQDFMCSILDIPIIGSDNLIFNYRTDSVCLVNGLGMMPSKNTRCKLYEYFKGQGYTFAQVIHPSAIISSDIKILEGVQIMAGAIIQTGAVIAENTIINTRVVVDHDTFIDKHVHLAPGTTVSGGVSIGEGTFVGAGSTIIQGIKIGAHCVVAAGSVVIQDIPDGARVMGIPARMVRG